MTNTASPFEIIPAETLWNAEGYAEPDNLFYSRRWVNVIRAGYDLPVHALREKGTNQYLLFSTVEDLLGRRVVSLPFSDYTRPQTETGRALEFLAELCRNFDGQPVVFKADSRWFPSQGAPDWVVTREAMYHQVAITTPEAMWEGLAPSFRRAVNRASRNNISVEVRTDVAGVERFYELHSRLRKEKFQSVPQPRSFFLAIHREFLAEGAGFVMEAVSGGELLASLVVLEHRPNLYYKFGASDEESLGVRPNNLLFWQLLLHARERGFEVLDLGLSGTNARYAGLVRFKEGLGGKPSPIRDLRYTPPGYDGQREAAFRAHLGKVVELLVDEKTDLAVTQRGGALLYRYFA